jgi:hypothetical protein
MKLYKNEHNEVYAYELDGSQDHLIPENFIQITQEEADTLREKSYTTPSETNKMMATLLLEKTDWVENPSVTDTNTSPYLLNKNDFDLYRQQLRIIATNPQDGDMNFPIKPQTQWSN